jgi:hypothetical protein
MRERQVSQPSRTYRVISGGKAAGAWRKPPTQSSSEVKERVEPYLYSPSVPSWEIIRWTLLLYTCITRVQTRYICYIRHMWHGDGVRELWVFDMCQRSRKWHILVIYVQGIESHPRPSFHLRHSIFRKIRTNQKSIITYVLRFRTVNSKRMLTSVNACIRARVSDVPQIAMQFGAGGGGLWIRRNPTFALDSLPETLIVKSKLSPLLEYGKNQHTK